MQKTKSPPSAAQAELDRLQLEQRQRQQAFVRGFDKLKPSEQGNAYADMSSKVFGEFWPKYQALIKRSQGGVQVRARMAAMGLAQMGQKPALGDRLIADILRENRDLPDVAQLAMQLRYENYDPSKREKLNAQLATLARSRNASVRAAVLYVQAEITKDKDARAAVPLYRQVLAKFPETSYAKRAQAAIYEAENLQIGMLAPEITGPDHEGNTFRLSEYRGKVVVLDFWGFW